MYSIKCVNTHYVVTTFKIDGLIKNVKNHIYFERNMTFRHTKTCADIIEFENSFLQLENQRSGIRTMRGFLLVMFYF